MSQVLIDYPLILLFAVASLGYLVGSIKIRSYSLGVAAVLFVGLAFGAVNPDLAIPRIILLLGLSIFVYSIGLSSGPAFFESFRRYGIKVFLFVVSMLLLTGLIAVALWAIFGFSAATITGAYAGSTTNTAALAGVLDLINNMLSPQAAKDVLNDTVVGYSFSYPMGVVGGIVGIVLFEKLLRIDFEKEKESLRRTYPLDENLTVRTIKIENKSLVGNQLRDIQNKYQWNVVFGRYFSEGSTKLATWNTILVDGDEVVVVGSKQDVQEVTHLLGRESDSGVAFDRSIFDTRRIFVSNAKVAGKTLASLNLHEKYDTVVTRIRRGDIDMIAKADTVLELGDRIRFIARNEDLDSLSEYFGDSYQESSKLNLFSFGLGIGIGLILGSIEFNIGSAFSFKLGYAGGPLIIGLLLGALKRTGPIVWTLPYSSNITLQQLGLIFLLSAIGVSSGSAFIDSLDFQGLCIIIASAVISLLTAFISLFIGYKFVKIPYSLLMGMVSNQPAILDFAMTRTKNRLPMYGFAIMFPLALIMKIIIAQVLFLLLM
jgi:putative transport protein